MVLFIISKLNLMILSFIFLSLSSATYNWNRTCFIKRVINWWLLEYISLFVFSYLKIICDLNAFLLIIISRSQLFMTILYIKERACKSALTAEPVLHRPPGWRSSSLSLSFSRCLIEENVFSKISNWSTDHMSQIL